MMRDGGGFCPYVLPTQRGIENHVFLILIVFQNQCSFYSVFYNTNGFQILLCFRCSFLLFVFKN